MALYNKTVELSGGGTIQADEAYLRESILNPAAKVVAGYQPIMPTFQGLVNEEGVLQLIEYIKSLTPAPGRGAGAAGTPAAARKTGTAAAQPAPGSVPSNR